MNIWAALGFIVLGAAISELYNYRIWQKYLDGMRNGISLKEWREGKTVFSRPLTRTGRHVKRDVKGA